MGGKIVILNPSPIYNYWYARIALKLIPLILLYYPTTSEADDGGMAEDVEFLVINIEYFCHALLHITSEWQCGKMASDM